MTHSPLVVAVYGSLKRGFHNHRLLGSSVFLGDACIQGYEMYSLGSYPMIVSGDSTDSIQIELYQVDEPTLQALDRLEGHPTFYCRQLIDSVRVNHQPLPAWLYVGTRDQIDDCPRVRDGVWRRSNLYAEVF